VLDLSAALTTALEAVAVARELLLRECTRPGGPRGEIGHCPADDEAEWAIRQHLLGAFPKWGFLGEETGSHPAQSGHDFVWVVDPNDGTTSMQRGYRGHAVSIALVHNGLPRLGVVCAVDAPDDDGDLWAWAEGCGRLQRNGVTVAPIAWQAALGPEDVVCLSQGANRNPLGYGPCVAPARFIGLPSIAYRLALVACGECAATVSLNHLSSWDYAGGHALLRGTGGVLVDDRGEEITYALDGTGMARRVIGGGRQVVTQLMDRPWHNAPGSGFGEAAPPSGTAPVRARSDGLMHDTGVLRRAQGCLLGQIAGDALGALVEFQSAQRIAQAFPNGGPRHLADGGPHRIIAGQPTDDSELALLLARSIVSQEGFDQEAIAAAYAGWYHGWTHSETPEPCNHPWCRPFDVGNTIARALQPVSSADVLNGCAGGTESAAASRISQANGALMRISPLGIWGTFRDPPAVAAAARQDAQLTHPHPVCQDANAVFAITIAAAIRHGLDPLQTYAHALNWARSTGVDPSVLLAVKAAQDHPPVDFLSQHGWVLIALQNAFNQLLHTPTAAEAVIATVRRGGDTDTNAAICGALLGAVHGRDAIPTQWQSMVLTCRPMPNQPGVHQPRPALYWPTDALVLAERLVCPPHAS
jgi:ADP-ribosyl-[dinitrogen reductase] hydrolase